LRFGLRFGLRFRLRFGFRLRLRRRLRGLYIVVISNFRFSRSDDGGKLADASGELVGGGSLDGKRHINSHYSPSHIETSCLITSMSAKVSPSAMWLARTSMTRSASTSVTQTHRVTASSGVYATTLVIEP